MKLSVYDEKKGRIFSGNYSDSLLIYVADYTLADKYLFSNRSFENPERTSQDIAYLDYLLELTISSGSFLELNLEKTPPVSPLSAEMIRYQVQEISQNCWKSMFRDFNTCLINGTEPCGVYGGGK